MNNVLDAVRAASPTVEHAAAEMEATRALTAEVSELVLGSGAVHLLVPPELGGPTVDLPGALEVWEELARQDGSVGWSVMAAGVSTGFAALYLDPSLVDELFCPSQGRPAVMAGQLSPQGTLSPVGGRLRAQGSYRFGSGSDLTTHMLGGCIVLDGAAPRMRDNGLPDVVAVLVPNEQVEFLGGWDVMGLEGTASVDYRFGPIDVDPGATFSIFREEPNAGAAMHRLGVLTLTAAGHAGVALGLGRRALDEIARLSATKARMGDQPLGEQPIFLAGYSRAEARLRAARALVMEAFGEAEAHMAATGEQPPRLRHLVRVATTWATEEIAEIVTWAYRESGTDGLRDPSPLGRCLRDVHAATQHVMVSRKTLLDAAPVLLGERRGGADGVRR